MSCYVGLAARLLPDSVVVESAAFSLLLRQQQGLASAIPVTSSTVRYSIEPGRGPRMRGAGKAQGTGDDVVCKAEGAINIKYYIVVLVSCKCSAALLIMRKQWLISPLQEFFYDIAITCSTIPLLSCFCY